VYGENLREVQAEVDGKEVLNRMPFVPSWKILIAPAPGPRRLVVKAWDGAGREHRAEAVFQDQDVPALPPPEEVSPTWRVATGFSMTEIQLYRNAAPQFDLGGDGPTPNDAGDGGTGANSLLNAPILERLDLFAASGSERRARLFIRIEGAPLTHHALRVFFGRRGRTQDDLEITASVSGGTTGLNTDASGVATDFFTVTIPNGVSTIGAVAMDQAGNMSEISNLLDISDVAVDFGCGACGLEWLIVPALAALRRRRRATSAP